MIFVHRDLSKVDAGVIAAAKKAQEELAKITDPKARKAFIDANGSVWTAFRPFLREMSHGKCWYSEAKEVVSRYDVDHFRPKGAARISETETSGGYSWLAFSPENYVLAGELCNQANREFSDVTVGKANWFPLQDPSKAATLDSPDYAAEAPVLLDPTDQEAPTLLEFGEDGAVHPRGDLNEDFKHIVEWAIRLLGIRQTALNDARRALWLHCHQLARQYKRTASKPALRRTPEEVETMREMASEFVQLTSCTAPFSATARTALRAERLDHFIRYDEMDIEAAA
ncbi:hypothetical protein [Brevundimonas sp.]|uniref:hypothetical protein n=1 Tax=Brevundimonas sp. TaxID=1871086 RepID=UPI0012255803|nr:hypothetical protein [Brevundimonas sp.]TAJ64226.1 MAG: hypothetical protein EPO49_05240 [Brevundimonas sp.]